MYRKKVGKRTYRKKASTFRKSVSTIARKVVLRQAETKTASINYLGAFGSNGKIMNLWEQLSVGSAQNNRVGDRIHALGFKIRGYVVVDSTYVTAATTDYMLCRFVIFSAKRPISSITDSGLTYNGTVDPELLNIHSDQILSFRQDGRGRVINKYKKYSRTVEFNPSASTVSKGELYFAMIPYLMGGSGLTTTQGLAVNCVIQPYWKDL